MKKPLLGGVALHDYVVNGLVGNQSQSGIEQSFGEYAETYQQYRYEGRSRSPEQLVVLSGLPVDPDPLGTFVDVIVEHSVVRRQKERRRQSGEGAHEVILVDHPLHVVTEHELQSGMYVVPVRKESHKSGKGIREERSSEYGHYDGETYPEIEVAIHESAQVYFGPPRIPVSPYEGKGIEHEYEHRDEAVKHMQIAARSSLHQKLHHRIRRRQLFGEESEDYSEHASDYLTIQLIIPIGSSTP